MSENQNRQEAVASWAEEEKLESELGLSEAARLLSQPDAVTLTADDGRWSETLITGKEAAMRRVTARWHIQLNWIRNPDLAHQELQRSGPVSTAIIIEGCVRDLRTMGGLTKPPGRLLSNEEAWMHRVVALPKTRGWDNQLYVEIGRVGNRRKLAEGITYLCATEAMARRDQMPDGGRVAAIRALEALIAIAETTQTWRIETAPSDEPRRLGDR